MKLRSEAIERRDHLRMRWRLPCALLVEGQRHDGIVRELSTGGLFVETEAKLSLGTEAIVAFNTPDGKRFVLEASIPHSRTVPQSLDSVMPGGVGMRVEDPPQTFVTWVKSQ